MRPARFPALLAAVLASAAVAARAEAPRTLLPEPPRAQPAAPAPAVEPGIRVEPLPTPDPAALGLPSPAGTGTEVSFAGSDPARLRALLARLPAAWPSEAVRRRLIGLLAGPWPGAAGGTELVHARAETLARFGAGAEAAELLLLPGAAGDESASRLAAAAALAASGGVEQACLVAGPLAAETFAVVALDFACAAALGDTARAALALDLARERGLELPPGFEAFARRVLDGEPLPVELPAGAARPAHLLLLARLPPALDGSLPAGLSTGVLPLVAANPAMAPELRLAAAERAAAAGRLSPRELRRLYLELAPPADEASSDPAPELQRAALLAAIAREEVPAARAALLRRAGAAVAAGIERVRWLEVLAPVAAELPVEPALLWAADGILPPLLAAGDFPRVQAWLRLAAAVSQAPAEARRALRSLHGPLLLAGLAGATESPRRPPAQRAILLALARGLGTAVPEEAWTGLAAEEKTGDPVPPPAVSAWYIAADAAAAGRTGEAELAAFALLAPAPEAASALALAHTLAVLRSLGQETVARELAVGVALALRL